MTAPAHPDRIFAAIGLRLVSVFLFAIMNAGIKLAELGGASLGEILFFRQFGAAIVVTAVIAAGPGLGSVRTRRIGAHVMRTAVGLTSMSFTFAAIMMLPLAEATIIGFTVPIFATILGAAMLREPTGVHRWGAVIEGFAGVLIVLRPGANATLPFWGAACGLTAALLTAMVLILLRQIGRTEAPLTTVFWFSVLSMVPLAPLFAWVARPHGWQTWAVLLGLGAVGGLAQIAMTSSLRIGPIAAVVPMDYTNLLWATLFGWWLFGALPADATWMGAPVIIASGLYIVWREHVRRRRETLRAIAQE